MAKDIWIVIANRYKMKVVSYQHPVYREQERQPDSGGKESRQRDVDAGRNYSQDPSKRYQYHVIRQFDVLREESPWSAYQETVSNDQDYDELSAAAALPMSNDPEITIIATKLSDYLSEVNSSGHFQQLILVAPKDVLSIIKSTLTPELQEHVMMELETELTDADPETLRANLPANV
jgi:protein required for attachment to host cells